MFYTYVLRCTKNDSNKLYTGFTKNLKLRIAKHLSKSVRTTSFFDKIELIYYESCLNEADARRREKELKTGFGRGYIKRRMKNYFAGIV